MRAAQTMRAVQAAEDDEHHRGKCSLPQRFFRQAAWGKTTKPTSRRFVPLAAANSAVIRGPPHGLFSLRSESSFRVCALL